MSDPPASDSGVPRADTPRRWRRDRVGLVLGGVVAVSIAVAAWVQSDRANPLDNEDEIDAIPHAENPGYLGAEACVDCHARRVREFQTTRHARACVRGDGIKAPGFEPGRGRFQSRDPSLRFEMTRLAGDHFITGFQRSTAGESRASYRLDLAYGAGGGRDEMYLAWEEDRLYAHHVGWLYPRAEWGHAADSLTARPALNRCLECHNTWIAHVPGTSNQYVRDEMILGATCESCHGPARTHVEYHRTHPNAPAHAITHPGHLERERQIEVCTQCHSPSYHRKTAPMSYRPGMPLDQHFAFTANRYPEDDLVANQIEYMRQSKCFQQSEMSCGTCHNPHRPEDHKSASRSCQKCHEPEACHARPRLPDAVRNDCAGCHAPRRIWMGALFHTASEQYISVTQRSDHRIAVHPDATQSVLLAHYRSLKDPASMAEAARLAKELSGYWIKEADRRRSQHRLLGVNQALREALRADPHPETAALLREAVARQAEFDRLVDRADADARTAPERSIQTLKSILALKPDHAKSHGKLGVLSLTLGRRSEAISHLERVADLDSRDAFGLRALATLAVQEGRFEDSLALFARADRAEPYTSEIHYDWGAALLRLNRWNEAEQHLRRALEINPRYAAASEKLSVALREQGDSSGAIVSARRAVRWSDERSVEAWTTLADAYQAANRTEERRSALERALRLARETRPDLVEELSRRLQTEP